MTWPAKLFHGRRYAVVGLGRNGLPVARALQAMGADVIAWDDRPEARDAARDLILCDPAADKSPFDALVLSPGIPHRLPQPHPSALHARELGIPIISDAELLFQAVRAAGSRARFVGITGTNGKSTTTALTAHILDSAGIAARAGGNLGPASLALDLLDDQGVYVLEMSSYMLERLVTLRFDAAAMLNLSPDHLERHGGMVGYAAAKEAIFDRQTEHDLAVIGIDDPGSRDMAGRIERRAARVIRITGHYELANAPALPGAHNAQNAAAAAAITNWLGASGTDIRSGLATFPGLPHRQENVGRIGDIVFVNDSKATNADAAARALGCYDQLVWVAGGIGKDGGIAPLVKYFPKIAHALLIGQDACAFAETLSSHGVSHAIAGTLDRAVPLALKAARTKNASVVLLSPAAASFDQFSGFDARGDRFRALVGELARSGGA